MWHEGMNYQCMCVTADKVPLRDCTGARDVCQSVEAGNPERPGRETSHQ